MCIIFTGQGIHIQIMQKLENIKSPPPPKMIRNHYRIDIYTNKMQTIQSSSVAVTAPHPEKKELGRSQNTNLPTFVIRLFEP